MATLDSVQWGVREENAAPWENASLDLWARISDHDALLIMKICSKIDIPVYKVRFARHEYRMISEPFNLDDWCT